MKIKNFVKELKNIKWSELKNWEFNTLKDQKRDVSKLKKTILEDGFTFPFIVWEEGRYVIDGTGRQLALLELEQEGYDIGELPIVSIEAKDKKDAKKKALLISSNYGSVTKQSLKNFIEEFELSELDTIQIGQKPLKVEDIVPKKNKDDVIPENPEPRTKPGDIYQLGEHRVMCGSSTDPEDMQKLMDGEKADMVFTDPPYNINFSGRGRTTSRGIKNDNMGDQEFLQFLKEQKELEQQGLTTIWTMKRDPTAEYVHPTQKPVELIEYAMKNSSLIGDIVLDQFGGSGSTLIAAEKLGRKARIMELDPTFVDIIVQRWEDYTGKKAEKLT